MHVSSRRGLAQTAARFPCASARERWKSLAGCARLLPCNDEEERAGPEKRVGGQRAASSGSKAAGGAAVDFILLCFAFLFAALSVLAPGAGAVEVALGADRACA